MRGPLSSPTGRQLPTYPWLAPFGAGGQRCLSALTRARLSPLLAHTGYDLASVKVRAGFTAQATAFVVADTVVVDLDRYCRLSEEQQLGLLAHEVVHCVQYAAFGRHLAVPRFLRRYLPEYWLNRDNYRLPRTLAETPLGELDVLSSGYTLDQIAERFRQEVDPDSIRVLPG